MTGSGPSEEPWSWEYREWLMVSTHPHIESWTTTNSEQAERCRKGGWDVRERVVRCFPTPWVASAREEST